MRLVNSPCQKICELDKDGICLGCKRTLEEIARWTQMSEHERAAVILRLEYAAPQKSPTGSPLQSPLLSRD